MTTKVQATILVKGPNSPDETHLLPDGASLVAGSDAACGIVLDAPKISPRHCVLHFEKGKLAVTDWFTESGTWVNGEKIYAETQLRKNDKLVVGPFEMSFSFSNCAESEQSELPTRPEVRGQVADYGLDVPSNAQSSLEPVRQQISRIDDEAEMLRYQIEELLSQNADLKREVHYQKAVASSHSADNSPYDVADIGESEQLRSEIESLHAELQRKDEEIEQLLAGTGDESGDETAGGSPSETLRLVNRLESLMDELKQSDDRIRDLEGLVQAADEAAMAERAEREQIGGWVSEIESRIAERESQWRLEEERLKRELAELTTRCQKAEQRAEKSLTVSMNDAHIELQRDIEDLKGRNQVIVKELMKARSDYHELATMIKKTGMSESEIREMNNKQSMIREQEIEIARERAAIARERAELANQREEIARVGSRELAPSVADPDQRIRMFREHLREIHDHEKEERRKSGLSGRIARLFRRLEDG
jgi:Inner membrane component of T3SS, cytoplasmic domain